MEQVEEVLMLRSASVVGADKVSKLVLLMSTNSVVVQPIWTVL